MGGTSRLVTWTKTFPEVTSAYATSKFKESLLYIDNKIMSYLFCGFVHLLARHRVPTSLQSTEQKVCMAIPKTPPASRFWDPGFGNWFQSRAGHEVHRLIESSSPPSQDGLLTVPILQMRPLRFGESLSLQKP